MTMTAPPHRAADVPAAPTSLDVLLVEDNAGDVMLIEEMAATLSRRSTEVLRLRSAGALAAGLAAARGDRPDVVLLDLSLPDSQGLETLERFRREVPAVPVIVLTGWDDLDTGVQAMRAGAQDYLVKGEVTAALLWRAVRYAVERVRADEALRATELHFRAVADSIAAEATLQHVREQIRFKDEFLSHVSHELRSPLTAIRQFTSILLGGLAGELNAEQHQYQQIVLKNVQQLQAMIDDLLEVTRLETGKMSLELERVSVRDAVTDALDTFEESARAKGITLSSTVAATVPAAHADPTRLRQILIILLDNAVKFTPAGGSVGIRAGLLPHDAGFLLVEVCDTGCGIDPAITEQIFERLYQVTSPDRASRKGLGLGLYICSELVTRQGGRIWAVGHPESGSTFSFTVPVFAPD